MAVPSVSQPAPGKFARALSAEVRSVMARKQVSGAQLARRVEKSNSYIAKRLRADAQFTANDIEDICLALGEDLLHLLVSAVRAMGN